MRFAVKCLLAGAVMTVGFTFGATLMVASAHHHHHWSPLDPSTYWQPNVSDEADGNDPAHYFYHDLGNNGGSVIDYGRSAQQKDKLGKIAIWLDYLKSMFEFSKKEFNPFGTGTTQSLENNYAQTVNLIESKTLTANNIDSKAVDGQLDSDGQAHYDSSASPYDWANASYAQLAQRLSDQGQVNQKIQDDLIDSLNALDNAQSEEQVAQASAHVKALKAMAWNQFGQYMSTRAQIRGIKERTDSAVYSREQDAHPKKNFNFDPLNNEEDRKMVEDAAKRLGIELYKPHGMPSFH